MQKKLNYFTSVSFLSKYIRRHRKNFIMFYFGWLFDTVLSIAMPILFGIMIDEIVYYQNLSAFLRISLVFVILSVFSCILYFLIYAQHHYLMNMYTFDIKLDIFKHLQKCDARYLSDAPSGDIITTLQSYTYECMHFIIRNVIHLTNCILCILALVIYLFKINLQIGLFILAAAPVSVWINARFGKKIRDFGDRQITAYGGYISWIYEVLSALRDIRMLGAQKKTTRTFADKHKEMFDIQIKSGISSLTAGNIIRFTNLAVQLSIYTFAGFLAASGNITIGLITIIIAFYNSLTGKLGDLSAYYLDAQNRVSYIQYIYDFLHTPVETDFEGGQKLIISSGNISFRSVSFAYQDGSDVLKNFSLEISPGERLALVGKSGSGKTTLAYMLIGFYRPNAGEIIIDGQKLSDCTLASIRNNIGLIAQDVLIFDGSVRENLLLGNRKATEEEIVSACEQAGLTDFVNELPNGLDTIIGSQGINLSGGQKQRIAIARIYLKKPKIIIFDEATSALDSDTEASIHEAFEKVLSGVTAIIIAHRLSSVMMCDRAAILEEGSIREIGIPDKMARNSAAFQSLFAIKEVEQDA